MRSIFIILLLIPALTFSQEYKKLSIIELSKKLSGLWVMKTFEKDSLTIVQEKIDGKILITTKIKDKPIKTEYKDILNVIELAFDGYGRSIEKKEEWISISDGPSSLIEYKNGKVLINTFYLGGEEDKEILELTDDKLILLNDTSMRMTYERLKYGL